MAEPSTSQLLREIRAIRRELADIRGILNTDLRTPDRLIKVSEACHYLGKKTSQVYRMIHSGQLPAKRVGNGQYQLSFNQVQQFINR